MTDFMRVSSAPEGRQSLSRTESSRSFSSEPSRSEESEGARILKLHELHAITANCSHFARDKPHYWFNMYIATQICLWHLLL